MHPRPVDVRSQACLPVARGPGRARQLGPGLRVLIERGLPVSWLYQHIVLKRLFTLQQWSLGRFLCEYCLCPQHSYLFQFEFRDLDVSDVADMFLVY